jgi:hypothetical protein
MTTRPGSLGPWLPLIKCSGIRKRYFTAFVKAHLIELSQYLQIKDITILREGRMNSSTELDTGLEGNSFISIHAVFADIGIGSKFGAYGNLKAGELYPPVKSSQSTIVCCVGHYCISVGSWLFW